MALIDGASAYYAFTVGMAALVNPCGAAMLPAYIGSQLGKRQDAPAAHPVSVMARGALLGSVATMGFIVVFGIIGAIIAAGGRAVIQIMPYAGLAIGIGVVLLALWLILTKSHIGVLAASRVSLGQGRGLSGLFLFGVGYAIASLSCALPLFLVVVVSSVTAGGFLAGLSGFLSYALGMGAMLILITMVVTSSQQIATTVVRRVLPYMDRVGNLLLLGAGIYIIYYWTLGTGGKEFLFA